MPGHLELKAESSGARHYLDARPVHAGHGLELLLAPDVWVPGRYEWTFRREDRPLLYLALGVVSDDENGPLITVKLPEKAVLRWPHE